MGNQTVGDHKASQTQPRGFSSGHENVRGEGAQYRSRDGLSLIGRIMVPRDAPTPRFRQALLRQAPRPVPRRKVVFAHHPEQVPRMLVPPRVTGRTALTCMDCPEAEGAVLIAVSYASCAGRLALSDERRIQMLGSQSSVLVINAASVPRRIGALAF